MCSADVTEEEKVLVLQGRDEADAIEMTYFKTHNKCRGKLGKDLVKAVQNVLHPKEALCVVFVWGCCLSYRQNTVLRLWSQSDR